MLLFAERLFGPKPVLIVDLVPRPEAPVPTIIRVLCVLNLAFIIVLTVIAGSCN